MWSSLDSVTHQRSFFDVGNNERCKIVSMHSDYPTLWRTNYERSHPHPSNPLGGWVNKIEDNVRENDKRVNPRITYSWQESKREERECSQKDSASEVYSKKESNIEPKCLPTTKNIFNPLTTARCKQTLRFPETMVHLKNDTHGTSVALFLCTSLLLRITFLHFPRHLTQSQKAFD